MLLQVVNTLNNAVLGAVPLTVGPITIGRGPDNLIRLESPLLSPRHVVIRDAGDGTVLVESAVAVNPATVNGRELTVGKAQRLRPGDEVLVAEFLLTLIVPGGEAARDGAPDPNSPSAKALALEEAVHDRLLAALNLQTVSGGERRNPEYVARIDRALLEIIRDRMAGLEAAVVDHFVAAYLRRRIAADVAAAAERRAGTLKLGSGGAMTDLFDRTFRNPSTEAMEVALGHVAARMEARLGLNLSRLPPGRRLHRDKVLDDMHAVDEKFTAALPAAIAELPPGGREHIVLYMVGKDLHDILFGLGPLEDLLRMPDVEEIMVLNEDQIYVGKEGRIEATGRRFFSRKVVISIIERIVGEVGRKIDFRDPLVDARLLDGSRVNAVIPPVAVSGPTLTIRRFPESRYQMSDLVALGSLTEGAAEFLRACVAGKRNILVSGGTGTGKTTLLNVMAGYIGRDERVVTIEDAAELDLPQKHVVTLEARPAGLEGSGAVTIDMLLRNALRMRPDRIIVGECRGAEAVEMLQAMNTGHEGSLTTVHANDVAEALQRIETMVLKSGLDMPSRAIREQITTAIELVVQISRKADGRRALTRISEVTGLDPESGEIVLQDVYAEAPAAGGGLRLAPTGYIPQFAGPLFAKGLLKVQDLLHG